jgi:hypothetical protein
MALCTNFESAADINIYRFSYLSFSYLTIFLASFNVNGENLILSSDIT